MNRNVVKAVMLALLTLVGGCASSTASGEHGRKITLVKPAGQTLRRGEINKVAITVLKENPGGDLAIKFSDLPAGVKVIEQDRKVKSDELIVTYTLHADNSAVLVDNHPAKVTAECPDGLAATETFEVTVKE